MIPVSPMFQEAALLSHTYYSRIDIYRNGALVAGDVKFTGGSLTSDAGSSSRLSCDFEVALNQWENLDIDPLTCRFKVYRGIDSIGYSEVLQLGEFRVNSIGRTTSRGTVPVKGVGLENYVIDAKFLQPVAPTVGAMTTEHIASLIVDALPGAQVVAMCSTDRRVSIRAPWEKERWEAVSSLASSISAEVFVDWTGRFIIRDIPNFSNTGPAFTLKIGENGAVIMPTIESDRSNVYNAVVALGEPTDSAIKPAFAVAKDPFWVNNVVGGVESSSPTRYGGPFGKATTFITSPYWTTDFLAQIAANNALALALAKSRTVSVDLLPLIYPEPGDGFELILEDGIPEIHIIQSINTPLAGGSSSLTTVATKTVVGG